MEKVVEGNFKELKDDPKKEPKKEEPESVNPLQEINDYLVSIISEDGKVIRNVMALKSRVVISLIDTSKSAALDVK